MSDCPPQWLANITVIIELLIEHPASGTVAVLLALVFLTLFAPAVWRAFRRILRKTVGFFRLSKIPGLSVFSQQKQQTTFDENSDDYFIPETQVGELQARLEAELNGSQQLAIAQPPSYASNSDETASQPEYPSQGLAPNDLVSRHEFGQLSKAVISLSQQTKKQQLVDSTLRERLKIVTDREKARSIHEARKVAATQSHLLNVKAELQSLQNLVVRQHREIKRLESHSPESRLSQTRQRLKDLTDSIATRSNKNKVLSTHADRIEILLKTKDNAQLKNQKNKLRVLIAKNRLHVIRERKALRLQQLIYKVQKLPYNQQTLVPLQLQTEINALKKNQQHLADVMGDLQRRSPEDIDSLEQLRQEIDESIRQLSDRIELQEDVLRATSVHSYGDHLNAAANDDTGKIDERYGANESDNPIVALNGLGQLKPKHTATTTSSRVTKNKADRKGLASKVGGTGNRSNPQKNTHLLSVSANRVDDLKQIFGIGYKLEVLLNKNGIFRFEQIAQLKDNEVDVLSEKIGCYSESIRRDRWIESANQLVADRHHREGNRSAGK